MRRSIPVLLLLLAGAPAVWAQSASDLAPGQTCSLLTQARADATEDSPNVAHDGSALPGVPAPDISQGFRGIPRSAQPPLTESQRRILECSYRLPEANADMEYTLFVPSTYEPGVPTPMVLNLHGLAITPLQQILFDGTTDFAERHGFIVVAPMGYNTGGWWGSREGGDPVEGAQTNPATGEPYTPFELSEIDAMSVLDMIRREYTVDENRIYLMGHSMGGAGTYHLGAKYNDVWAAIAPLAGAGGIDEEAAEAYLAFPTLLMHGAEDSIVAPTASRRAAMRLQAVGAQHVYLEFPGLDHEFWIRRGAENMERVFLFFDAVSKDTHLGPVTDDMLPEP